MAEQNKAGEGIGCLIVIVAAAFGLYAMDWNFSGNQITDYLLECRVYDAASGCNGQYVKGPVTTYTVNFDQQVVISQVDGEAPVKLTKCAVVNRKNWTCHGADNNEFITTTYTDGEIHDAFPSVAYKHVSRYEWLLSDKSTKH